MNYKELKNLIFNELGISKEDIKEWVKEAVTDVAKTQVKRLENSSESMYDIIGREVGRYLFSDYGAGRRLFESAASKAVIDMVSSRIDITLKEPVGVKDDK